MQATSDGHTRGAGRAGYLRRRLAAVATILAACAALALHSDAPATATLPAAPPRDFSRFEACPVLAVEAGTIIRVRTEGDERRVRLIGVFVPKAGSDEDGARPFLERLLGGESVFLEYESDWPLRDREDRYWAYVYRAPDGLLVNLELLRQGYGRLSAPEPFAQVDLFRAYERHARQARKGVWGEPGTVPSTRPAEAAPSSPQVLPAPRRAAESQPVVYVTRAGTRDHLADCQHARSGATPITLEEAKSRGLKPCSRCKPPE